MKETNGLPGTWGSRGWEGRVGSAARGAAFAEGAAPIAGFGAPGTGAAVTPGVQVPGYTLFDASAVFLASILGSPAAGGIVMAINYRRLGKSGGVVGAVVLGIVVTGLAALTGNLITGTYALAAAVVFAVAMRWLAQAMQGSAVAQHIRQGGALASRWGAAAVGLAMLAVLCVVFLAGVYGWLGNSKMVTIGTKDNVEISGASTKEEAKALGQALQTTRYFQDKGASVLLDKGKNGTVVSFVVKPGFWDQAEMVSGFAEVGREVAPAVGGYPIQVRLINADREVKKELTVGRVVFGTKDEIFYLGSATTADANALGQKFKENGFFTDRGASVMLSKGDGVTTMSFVVADGTWDQADKVAAFETIARGCAGAVGGLPIKVRLTNSNVIVKKEVTVN